MLKKNELVEYFYKGIKDKKNLKIGVEHEKFVLSKNGFHPVSYEMQNGIKDILLKFVSNGWKPKYDDEEKIMVEMDSEKQKVNISPKLLSELEGKNIFYKLN